MMNPKWLILDTFNVFVLFLDNEDNSWYSISFSKQFIEMKL